MTSMALSLQLSSAAVACCCSCCGSSGCSWSEPWDNLTGWFDLYQAAVEGHRFVIAAPHTDVGLAARLTDGAYSVSFELAPGAADGSSVAAAVTASGLFDGALSVSTSLGMGHSSWFVGGLATPGGFGVNLTPSNPDAPQLCTVQWNDAGQWTVTVGDASVTGAGLGVVADFPTKLFLFISDLPGDEAPPSVGPITASCTQLPTPSP